MPKLVAITKSVAGLSYELGKNWVTIGRAAGNAFQIVETSVSGQHCEVLLRVDELLVRVTYIHIRTSIQTNTYMYTHTYIHTCHIYIYIYIYIHMHIYTHA